MTYNDLVAALLKQRQPSPDAGLPLGPGTVFDPSKPSSAANPGVGGPPGGMFNPYDQALLGAGKGLKPPQLGGSPSFMDIMGGPASEVQKYDWGQYSPLLSVAATAPPPPIAAALSDATAGTPAPGAPGAPPAAPGTPPGAPGAPPAAPYNPTGVDWGQYGMYARDVAQGLNGMPWVMNPAALAAIKEYVMTGQLPAGATPAAPAAAPSPTEALLGTSQPGAGAQALLGDSFGPGSEGFRGSGPTGGPTIGQQTGLEGLSNMEMKRLLDERGLASLEVQAAGNPMVLGQIRYVASVPHAWET
jgi:hypothetical protein